MHYYAHEGLHLQITLKQSEAPRSFLFSKFILLIGLQGIKPSEPPPKPTTAEDGDANPFAIARPHATDLMLQRQTSFREFSRLQSRTSPFKRQLSLRMSELPSSLERRSNDAAELAGSTNRK